MVLLKHITKQRCLTLKQFAKQIHISSISCQKERTFREIRVPVPWGHLAGKWWGPMDKRPILCLHGWMESCGSFDPLMKLLPEDRGFLALDFPGHGYSSRLPDGCYYHDIDFVVLIRRIHKYFEWPKISFISHSMGGVYSFMYTSLFPNDVDMLVVIDALRRLTPPPSRDVENTVTNIEQFLKFDELNRGITKPPAYDYENIVAMMLASTYKSLTEQSCKYILQRTIEKASDEPDKYYFKRDNRLKVKLLVGLRYSDIINYAKRVICPMLLVKASHSTYPVFQPYFEDAEYGYEAIDELKRRNKAFEYVTVEGTHHVHVNESDKVAPLINNFLKIYDNGDRTIAGFKDEILVRSG